MCICICEAMAAIDLGIATSVLATFLGSDPITVGATPEQKKLWLGKIADEGILFAYGATEPDAGSDLGALKTTAERVMDGDKIIGYRISGLKQWISNGGIADAYSILANAPGGPSWFVVEEERRASRMTSRRTSTASAPAIPRPWRSKVFTSRLIASSAAWKAKACCRRRRYLATPA